jgi:hypothetical protein
MGTDLNPCALYGTVLSHEDQTRATEALRLGLGLLLDEEREPGDTTENTLRTLDDLLGSIHPDWDDEIAWIIENSPEFQALRELCGGPEQAVFWRVDLDGRDGRADMDGRCPYDPHTWLFGVPIDLMPLPPITGRCPEHWDWIHWIGTG